MEKYKRQNNFQRHFDYFKERIIISVKSFIEYKGNFYSIFISEVFTYIITLVFYFVYIDLSENSFLDWNLLNFLIFLLLVKFSLRFNNLFYFSGFSKKLLNGDLNSKLLKPISPYFAMILNLASGKIVMTSITFILLVIILLYSNFENYFLALLIWIIGFIGSTFLVNTLAILSFFLKGNIGLPFIKNEVEMISKNFTYAPFENQFLISKILFLFLPQSLIAYLTLNILLGKIIYFSIYFIPVLFYSIIIILFHLFLWKIGLKKYEAFV